jgi:hypothetical protein
MEESIERYFEKYKDIFDEKVIVYVKDFINVINDNNDIKEFFAKHEIPIIDFANELSSTSQLKLKVMDDFKLTQEEINAVMQDVLLSCIFCKLLQEDHVEIVGISKYGTLEYSLDDYAAKYIKDIVGIDFNDCSDFDDN